MLPYGNFFYYKQHVCIVIYTQSVESRTKRTEARIDVVDYHYNVCFNLVMYSDPTFLYKTDYWRVLVFL